MNYNELTDPELVKLVAKRQGVGPLDALKISDCGGLLFSNYKVYNPLKNPSDAWPIILENKISIQHNVLTRGADWFAGVYCFDGEPIETDYMDNPLRAAMIVYLMMGDE